MVGEVIARTIENLFSWTTLIGIAVFTALNLLSRPSCVEDSGGILDGVFLKEADEAFSVSLQSA